MAYKYSVGERKFGDIKAQNDAEGDTLIDFDEDFIDLKTGGQSRIKISGSNITFNDSFVFPTTDGNTNQVLTTDGNGNLSFQAPATGSGGNPPGGADRQVQFNDNGSFAGNSGIIVDQDFNLKVSGSLIGKDSIGVGMELGGGRNANNEWVSITTPEHKFHVVGDITEAGTFSVDTAADSVGGSYWTFSKARGTPSNPAAVQTNDEIGRIQFFAHTGTANLKRSAVILTQTDSDGDGRLKIYVTKGGDVDNVAIECYNNQVTIQDQMVIGAAGIIPISNGGASIGGVSSRFDYIRGNNLVAFNSFWLGGTHPIYDKGGFGISINKDHLPIGNYTSGEGLTYVSNNPAVENVILALHKTGSHFGGIAINGSDANNDEKLVFFSKNNTSGFVWKNNIPDYGTNGMGNLDTTGTTLMELNSSGLLTIGGITLPNTDGTSGQVLKTDGNGNVSWQNESAGGGGSPAGSNTEIQYNNNGSFGASSNLAFDGSALMLEGNLQVDGEIQHNNFKKTSYPSNQSNTGSYAAQKSFVKEFMYAKYNWSDSSTVDLFTIEPYDERTGSPYAGSNIWSAVGIEITAVGHYKGAPQGNLFSKIIGVIHWSGGSRSGLSTTNISAGADASSWFSVGNSGTLGQTLKFQYNVGSWNDGPGMIHIKIYTGYSADNPAVNDDGKHIYWVVTEHFNQPSE